MFRLIIKTLAQVSMFVWCLVLISAMIALGYFVTFFMVYPMK